MGGRGSFAAGKNVPYTYETIGKIYGIKILKGICGKHGLPEESHNSSAYITLNPDKSVRQIRTYDKKHMPVTDYDFSSHQGKVFLHAHDYINGVRNSTPRTLSPQELKKFGKYFGGKNDK